jgi:hypothetical protein
LSLAAIVENEEDSALDLNQVISSLPSLEGLPTESAEDDADEKPTKAEKKKLKALEERCKHLTNKVEKKNPDLRTAQQERSKAEKKTKDTIAEHKLEFARAKAALEEGFRDRYEKLRKTKGTQEELRKADQNKLGCLPFVKNIRNWCLLDRLEWLTSEIVEFDRQKSGSVRPALLVSLLIS